MMLTLLVIVWETDDNLARLLPEIRRVADGLGLDYEVLVMDASSSRTNEETCRSWNCRYLKTGERRWGLALLAGLEAAGGSYILTMDADLSHPADFIRDLWSARQQADVIVASRYAPGGKADMGWPRLALSRLLNGVFRRALHLPVKDMSSGFRLYRAAVLKEISPRGKDYNVLQEILIEAYASGFTVREIPFHYRHHAGGAVRARLIAFGIQYMKTFGAMWRLRNSIFSGDYDARAFDSLIPLQRWWQRRRYRIITGWLPDGAAALDVGCGSSRILGALPPGSVGLDPSLVKLRNARRFGRALISGGLPRLPVRGGAFPVVLCSEVIEHIPRDEEIFSEFRRVLAPGGTLILGTPDYGRLVWRVIETMYRYLIPGGYADTHISRYTRRELTAILNGAGFDVLDYRYIAGGELIMLCRRSI